MFGQRSKWAVFLVSAILIGIALPALGSLRLALALPFLSAGSSIAASDGRGEEQSAVAAETVVANSCTTPCVTPRRRIAHSPHSDYRLALTAIAAPDTARPQVAHPRPRGDNRIRTVALRRASPFRAPPGLPLFS